MIEIRAAVSDDLVAITNLLATPDELFLVYPKGRFPFTIPQAQKLFNERFEFTVLCDGDKIAGFANLYDRQQDEHAFIGNVFIAPEYRRQGLGKLLLNYMIKAAFAKYRFREVRLSVFSDNAPAVTLYESLGFRTYSSEQRLDPENRTRTLVHMKLANTGPDLQPPAMQS